MKPLLVFWCCFFALVLAVPRIADAQEHNVAALADNAHVASFTTGAEHGFMFGLGYARVVAAADRALVLGTDVTFAWAKLDSDDFRVRARALVPIVGRTRWKVIGAATAIVRGAENDIARLINVGTDIAVLAGRYAPRGLIAVELGFDWALTTHIEHSDAYRMTSYPSARDGWYASPGGMIRAGVQSGVSLGRHDVILRVGRMVDIAGKPPLFPFYGTLTFDTRW